MTYLFMKYNVQALQCLVGGFKMLKQFGEEFNAIIYKSFIIKILI